MRKLLVILFSFTLMTSCSNGEYPVEDYVVDLNWNSAVKDLYLMDTEIAPDTASFPVVRLVKR
jgi:hypothetical protein